MFSRSYRNKLTIYLHIIQKSWIFSHRVFQRSNLPEETKSKFFLINITKNPIFTKFVCFTDLQDFLSNFFTLLTLFQSVLFLLIHTDAGTDSKSAFLCC